MQVIYVLAGISIIPLVLWGLYTQSRIREVYRVFSKEKVKKGITGSRLARTMLNEEGLENVIIEEVSGELTDHYDPRRKVVRLSRNVARSSTVAACGIAAHEAAHAIQDGIGYGPVQLRDKMAPIVQGAGFWILPLLLVGIFMGSIVQTALFINLAIFLYIGIVLFYLVTLPVEFDASKRAVRFISDKKIADKGELAGINKVLNAAALTYVAAAVLAVIQLLRLIGIMKRR